MSRKTPSKSTGSSASGKSSSNSLLIGAVIVAILGVGAFAMLGGKKTADPGTPPTQDAVAAAAQPTPEIIAATQRAAAIGPHRQAVLPPIPFQGYEPPRSRDVVTAAFHFAAEHPEVSSYMPCFCGCQQGGHKGNEDCFVKQRDASGDVVEWEPHGVDCAVCIDVATRSRQMHSSGASVTQIRTAIEKEFLPTAMTMTPTPKPPAPGTSGND